MLQNPRRKVEVMRANQSRTKPRLLLRAVAVAMLALIARMEASVAQMKQPMEHVNIRLNFLPGAEHAFLYLGQQKGWYADEGIDLEVVPGQGSTVAVKTVGSGEDQFAIADTASVARGWEAGVPIVYVAMLLKNTPTAIFSLPSKNIRSMEDLCGKRVGVNLKSTTAEQYHAMVRLAKLTCSIEEVSMNSGGSKEVLTNLVDAAVNFSYTDALRVKVKAGGVNVILARQYFDFFSLGIISNRKLLAEKPDLAHRFLKVTMRSLSYALHHREEALEAFTKVNPEADRDYESAKLDAFGTLVAQDGSESIGMQSPSGWQASLTSLYDIGILKSPMNADGRFAVAK
jgi:NitT/TauT family transport system substrate-binding protein